MLEPALLSGRHNVGIPLGRYGLTEGPHLDELGALGFCKAKVVGQFGGVRPKPDDADVIHDSKLRNVVCSVNTKRSSKSDNYAAMLEPHERLRIARQKAGYESAAEAARAFGWTVVSYTAHENGSRGLRPLLAQRYGLAFRVSDAWLLTGRGDMTPSTRTVRVVGFVGAGGQVQAIANDEGIDEIDAPPGTPEDASAVIVRGDSAYPIFEDGEVLIFSEQRSDIDNFLNRSKPMIVALRDGRRLLKTVTRGRVRGRYTLMSHNAAAIDEVEIDWVSRIDWARPRR